jgi:predicted nucleotidyltransferase
VRALADRLSKIPGVAAVALGGSRANRTALGESDWDFGLYYRGELRAEEVRALGYEGTVVDPGEWGRLPNGGARLTVEGERVELRYRELDVVRHWLEEAEAGRYELDLVEAAIEAAQAALAERCEWALSERGIVRRAGLGSRMAAIMAAPGDRPFELARAVTAGRAGRLGVCGRPRRPQRLPAALQQR